MHVWYIDAGIEDTPEPVYTHCLVLSCIYLVYVTLTMINNMAALFVDRLNFVSFCSAFLYYK